MALTKQETKDLAQALVDAGVTTANGYTDDQIAAVQGEIDGLAGGFQGALAIADTPANDGVYFPSEDGTYANAGSVVVDLSDGLTYIIKSGSTYTKNVVPIDLTGYVSKGSVDKVTVIGKNIFDKNTKTVSGYSMNTSGSIIPNATSATSDFIACKPSTSYTISGRASTIKGFACYDASHILLPVLVGANYWGGSANGTYTTPADAAYIRFSIMLNSVGSADTIQLEEGTSATTYEAYNETKYITGIGGEDIDLRDLFHESQIVTISKPGKNIFDKDTQTVSGYSFSSSGNTSASATSKMSDLIPCDPNTIYTISGRDASVRGFGCYDASQNLLPVLVGSNYWGGSANGAYTTPADAAYIRFSIMFNSVGSEDTIQLEKGSVATEYEDYELNTYIQSIKGLVFESEDANSDATRTFAKQAVSYQGDELIIVSRYSDDSNVRIKFRVHLANDTFAIYEIVLIENRGTITESDFTGTSTKTLLDAANRDVLSPYTLNNDGQEYTTNPFIGGNHNVGSLKTSTMLERIVYADGLEIDGQLADADEVIVTVKNELYSYKDLYETGTQTVVIYEHVAYKVVGGQIEVTVQLEAVDNIDFARIYSIQGCYSGSDMSQMYCAHCKAKTLVPFPELASLTVFGSKQDYPHAEKAILIDSTSSDGLSYWLDQTRGIGLNNVLADPSTRSAILTTDAEKLYHQPVIGSIPLLIGQSVYYHGGFAPFRNLSSDSEVLAYFQHEEGKLFLNIDFCIETGTKDIYINHQSLYNKSLSIVSKDATVIISDLFVSAMGLHITADGYGNVKLQIQ